MQLFLVMLGPLEQLTPIVLFLRDDPLHKAKLEPLEWLERLLVE
jgi:hypothetical protein